MATRTPRKKDPEHPDGAKPGAEAIGPSDKYAFDADGRAKAREGADVTTGEQVFHRRRKNWKVTRDLRDLMRVQERASGRMARLQAQIDALTEKIRGVRDSATGDWLKPPLDDDAEIAKIETEVEELEAKVDTAQDESDEAAFEIIALLLQDDDGKSPDIEHLKEHLDVEDAGALAASLSGGGEDPADPTATASSSD